LSRIHVLSTREHTRSSVLLDTQEPSDLPEPQEPTDPQENQTHLEETGFPETYPGFLKADTAQLGPTPNIVELIGDIFETELGFSLAYCVSVNMKMYKGMALEFSRKYGRLDELRLQNNSITQIASIWEGNRYIFYLLTEELQWQRSSYENLFKSLQNLKVRCKELRVTKLACLSFRLHLR